MRLPIKHEFFELLKNNKKPFEYRDAHITFEDEQTGEELRKEVIGVHMADRAELPIQFKGRTDCFEDQSQVVFHLK